MLVWFSIGLLALFCFIALFNALAAPRLARGSVWFDSNFDASSGSPFVSVIVPARNEAHQIESCLTALLANEYQSFEVIVGDDQSTDGTGDLVQSLQAQVGDRLKLIRLTTPPAQGWTGKARTCQELVKYARGEMLVFCDADVVVGPQVVKNTVGSLLAYQAGALTVLPRQLGGSPLVQALVAVVTQFLILISLPLWLVPRLRSPGLATGNGQWFAWQRETYNLVGGHAAVRASLIEDVELGRLVKKVGHKLVPACAAGEICVQMYQSWAEARQGFRKNLFALLGGSQLALMIVMPLILLLLVTPVLAVIYNDLATILGILLLNTALLGAQRLTFKTPWRALALFPFGILLALSVLCESAFYTRKGDLAWKGRSLEVS